MAGAVKNERDVPSNPTDVTVVVVFGTIFILCCPHQLFQLLCVQSILRADHSEGMCPR